MQPADRILPLLDAATDYYLAPLRPLLAAMVAAEGGAEAFVKAVQCSMPATRSFEGALARGCKTVRNALRDYAATGQDPFGLVRRPGLDPWTGEARPRTLVVTRAFLRYLANRWAPIGVANDPTNLNANWGPNVVSLYAKGLGVSAEELP